MDRISEESGVEWIVKKEEIFEYVQKQYGTLPEYLWSKLPDSAVPVSYTHLLSPVLGMLLNIAALAVLILFGCHNPFMFNQSTLVRCV